jgi:hypothetical protein
MLGGSRPAYPIGDLRSRTRIPYAALSQRPEHGKMSIREASPRGQHPTLPAGGEGLAPSSIRANNLPEPPKPRLLDRVRQALRTHHMSRRTEEAYVAWIRRFIFFHDKRHPQRWALPR